MRPDRVTTTPEDAATYFGPDAAALRELLTQHDNRWHPAPNSVIAHEARASLMRVLLEQSGAARARRLALAWINQTPDGCEDTAQQIKDGHTLLRWLDGEAS